MNNALRPVRDRRPARRQHPRAAGHGVLRVERARRERRAPARWSIRAGVSPANVDRAIASIDEEVARLVRGRRDAAGARRIAAVSDRLDAARARDQRRRSRISCRTRSSSASASTTTCACPALLSAVTLDDVHAAARRALDPGARHGRRSPGPYQDRSVIDDRVSPKAVFFDVDFTLIYPGPTFRGEGYQAFCARYGIDVDPSKFEAAVASAAPLLDSPRTTSYDAGDLHRVHQPDHRADGRRAAGASTSASREIYREWAACQPLRAVRRCAGGAARSSRPPACASA